MNDWELNRREASVLEAVVLNFLRTGQPVASREVAATPGQRLSPASIRGVMGRLEEAGLLSRPHPSAGCTPTDRGLRHHIDGIVREHRPSAGIRRHVKARFDEEGSKSVTDLGWVATIAADLTREAGVSVRPVGEMASLEGLTLVPVGGSNVLGVVVTSDGWVGKRVSILREQDLTSDLPALAAQVNRRFGGDPLDSIRQWLVDNGQDDPVITDGERRFLLEIFADPDEGDVQVAGAENLLSNEAFTEVGRIRSVVRVLEDRPRLAGEWRRALQSTPTRVLIGEENPLTAGGNLGMVATLYYCQGQTVGAVGIVGPRRMPYKTVVPVVECIGETLSSYLETRAAG